MVELNKCAGDGKPAVLWVSRSYTATWSHRVWRRPSRSASTTINQTYRGSSLNHVLQCHIHVESYTISAGRDLKVPQFQPLTSRQIISCLPELSCTAACIQACSSTHTLGQEHCQTQLKQLLGQSTFLCTVWSIKQPFPRLLSEQLF